MAKSRQRRGGKTTPGSRFSACATVSGRKKAKKACTPSTAKKYEKPGLKNPVGSLRGKPKGPKKPSGKR